MAARADIDGFLALRKAALVGASRSGRKFGNSVLKELAAKGWELYPVHPEAAELGGLPCRPDLASLPEDVRAAILITPPAVTEVLVREAADAGLTHVWLQQGAASPAAVEICRDRSLVCIHDQCILMFAEPAAWMHRLHRGLWRWLGKLPK